MLISWGSAAQYIKIKIQFISSPAQQIINNNDAKYWSSQIVTRMRGPTLRSLRVRFIYIVISSIFHAETLSHSGFILWFLQIRHAIYVFGGGQYFQFQHFQIAWGRGKNLGEKEQNTGKYLPCMDNRLKYAHEQIYRSLTMNIVDPLSNSSGEYRDICQCYANIWDIW